jgi:hypothetical protein
MAAFDPPSEADADAVLGLRDGRKLLPCCEDCHAAKKKPLAYGKADQPMAQAAKRARKVEERTESAAKRRGRGRGCGRGRGRGRGRGQLPDSSDEDEEMGGAHTPSPHAPVPRLAAAAGATRTATKTTGQTAARRRLSTTRTEQHVKVRV